MTPLCHQVPAVELREVRKSYIEGMPVLTDVDLKILHGTVTALVGANGSGKSTMVRILSGYHPADEGSAIVIAGHSLGAHVTSDAVRAAGLRFVHQDSGLVPGISVLENMLVGRYRTGNTGRILWREERRSVAQLLATWNIDADLDVEAGSLPLPTVAKLAVLRALHTEGDEQLNAVILDEPTATLGRNDANELLRWLRDLATEQNVGILFISHRLDEIFTVADQIAVLRGGRIAANRPVADFDHDGLVEEIVGGNLDRFYPAREVLAGEEVRLSVRGLSGAEVTDVSFDIHAGEVVGITGLPGSGFENVPYLLADPETLATGEIDVDGSALRSLSEPIDKRIRRGLALIPADRKRNALVTDLTIRENLTLPRLQSFIRHGWLSHRRESADARNLVETYGIKTPSPNIAASELSGGNQQKVVLAKWISTSPSVMIVHEPTHGVDIGAKSDIFSLIADSAAAGMAALIATVEYEDLTHICDRVLVFSHGMICAELTGSALTPEAITAAAFYGTADIPAA